MDVPEGLISRLCHLLAFLPFFLLLLLLAVVKAAFIAPIVFVTVLVGNTALILGLYPLHAVWTCYCIARISQVPGYILAGILARPKYRKAAISRSASLPRKHAPARAESLPLKRPLIKTASMKMQELKAIVIWDNFFMACESAGKELIRAGAIRDNVELTYINRPEGRVFDWLFEPMTLLKEQIKAANLESTEEEYLYKLALYCGDARMMTSWQNGGVAPADAGFSLTISRMPTFRRRFEAVVKALLQEARQGFQKNGNMVFLKLAFSRNQLKVYRKKGKIRKCKRNTVISKSSVEFSSSAAFSVFFFFNRLMLPP
ncbi:hypothetical protein MUK42_16925 [Musa troglodytarum]|uniref:Uncharacterized protein n=1 Tax=Musa troglodytarum TaxID=320322 RepID=A0A9E7KTT7_9LILI|nr:hypothetical protein MUK42_16925 [Musa troglodytarum]